MPFSKFEPHRRDEPSGLQAANPVAERRALLLKWANWIVLVYTAFGFGLIAYWLLR